jgi:Xaa-Pro dipeptidase
MAAENLDAVILNPGPSQFYFSGLHLHLMERPMCLLIDPVKTPAIVLPELEQQQVALAGIPLEPFFYGANPAEWQQAYQQAADYMHLDGKTVGIEPTQFRYLEMQYIQQAAPNVQFTSAESCIAQMRMRKDAQEKSAMQAAIQISEQALLAALKQFNVGMTELEFSSELLMQMLRAGAESLAFGTIVSGGPNSANPHAVPGNRPIQSGDLLVIDYGAMKDGYCADITRTFGVGEIEPEFEKIHQITQAANAAARAFARPGVRAGDVDTAAREVIEAAGYGAYFTHRVGHGLGMEGHEPPYMHGGNDLILEEGMTFTIEPGIYLPGRGGVRVEDDVILTADGCESLTTLPRELQLL